MSCRKGLLPSNPELVLDLDEKILRCPFDKSHLIVQSSQNMKFTKHLFKCRKTYIRQKEEKGEKVVYEKCINGCGPLLPPEAQYHFMSCSPKPKDEYENYFKSKEFQKLRKEKELEEKTKAAKGKHEEDWEEEAKAYQPAGYDPRVKLVRDNIIIIPPGSKQERREFREKFIIKPFEEEERMGLWKERVERAKAIDERVKRAAKVGERKPRFQDPENEFISYGDDD